MTNRYFEAAMTGITCAGGAAILGFAVSELMAIAIVAGLFGAYIGIRASMSKQK